MQAIEQATTTEARIGHEDKARACGVGRSYKPMFVFSDGKAYGNAQRFATYNEAYRSAQARFAVWTMPQDYLVEASDDAPNYVRDELGDHPIT